MQISHPDRPELTPAAQQQLDQLQSIIRKAAADGVITQSEHDRILAQVWADGKPSFEELELLRTMICEKVDRGELTVESCDSLMLDNTYH